MFDQPVSKGDDCGIRGDAGIVGEFAVSSEVAVDEVGCVATIIGSRTAHGVVTQQTSFARIEFCAGTTDGRSCCRLSHVSGWTLTWEGLPSAQC
jgi:hypothetical protein